MADGASRNQVRFELVEGADIDDFIASTDSSNTRKVIKFGVDVFFVNFAL